MSQPYWNEHAAKHPLSPDEPMQDLQNPQFAFGLREGAHLKLPAVDLTAWERVTLVASIARALGLPDVDEHIRSQWPWAC